jgi:hypothetical protein
MYKQEWLDDMRSRIQQALIDAKRTELSEKYGAEFPHISDSLDPELTNKWLDHVLEFERQAENPTRITVRERIGNPPIVPVAELPLYALSDAVTAWVELLAAHGIAVEFLGDFDDLAAYSYLIETLLDEEIDDIRIEGMYTVFTPSTVENDVQMWVGMFVGDLFIQEQEDFLSGLKQQPLLDVDGNPVEYTHFRRKIESIWLKMPKMKTPNVTPLVTQVDGDFAVVVASVKWRDPNTTIVHELESRFHLQPSPYTGWDVVYTSLLDDLLMLFE